MSETFIIYLSPRGPDESGGRNVPSVSLPLTLKIWFVGWLTFQLNGFRARENVQEEKNQALVLESHPFHAILGKSIAWLVNSTLNFTRKKWYHFSREI